MDDVSRSRPTDQPAESTKADQIRDAAMRCFAERGIAATSLRVIAETAGVSLGLIQHYYATKHQLIASIDEHALTIFQDALHSPSAADSADPATNAGRQFAALMCQHPDVMDYVGRALAEGGEVGNAIFDGLYAISAQQGATFAAQGLTPDDLDPLWASLLPLIIRIGTVILRPHIERYTPAALYDPAQTSRWDASVTRLICEGQLKN